MNSKARSSLISVTHQVLIWISIVLTSGYRHWICKCTGWRIKYYQDLIQFQSLKPLILFLHVIVVNRKSAADLFRWKANNASSLLGDICISLRAIIIYHSLWWREIIAYRNIKSCNVLTNWGYWFILKITVVYTDNEKFFCFVKENWVRQVLINVSLNSVNT
jgi:hypothetical protein